MRMVGALSRIILQENHYLLTQALWFSENNLNRDCMCFKIGKFIGFVLQD